MLERINGVYPDLKPTDNIPEEFYEKLMNIVHIFVGVNCIDQMLKHLCSVGQKQLTLICHNGSDFDNRIIIKNMAKLPHCPLKNSTRIFRIAISNPFTEKSLQKKWNSKKKFINKNNHFQKINFTCFYQHLANSLKDLGQSSKLPMYEDLQVLKMDIEAWEWDTFPNLIQTNSISHIKQLFIEFHTDKKCSLSKPGKCSRYISGLKIFHDLYELGFRIFWTHKNPACLFKSKFTGEELTFCHEIYFVKVS
ncbi:hypothetical protein LOTGIDRAFT_172214 [Lottia gigantea]|uniref:Methyltransferase domain-containing protein n=1 Tax=Lottia gigantea TaxID=225164 RepID=V4AEB8_LOTGI|nr:hypothetical protein LOTGIDRAFT_172214 [Lottia gigantea]ESP02334.1 hypothetical protein LOTGIDRAFT_172214 [Lottia gigantea]